MVCAEGKPLVTADALGGYFAVVAMQPSATFYSHLREGGANGRDILWIWFCLVLFFVDLAVQRRNEGAADLSERANEVLVSLLRNIKAIEINSDDDLEQLEAANSLFWGLLSNFMLRHPGGLIEIGQQLSRSADCEITNPATLLAIGSEFMELHTSVLQKFSNFEIV